MSHINVYEVKNVGEPDLLSRESNWYNEVINKAKILSKIFPKFNFLDFFVKNWQTILQNLQIFYFFQKFLTGCLISFFNTLDRNYAILGMIFWCLKYIFTYSRQGHFMTYHHFLTKARYFFTNKFFSKKFFFDFFFSKKLFFSHLMFHKQLSKIRFYIHKTMKFYEIS